jgi:hypothetical protein
MRASLPNAETIAVLLEPRMLIRCPPVELNAAVPYDGWSDVDALVRGTSMDAYADVVEQMAAVGALGRGWAALSLRRGFTLLRHPLHPKPAAPKETDEKF